MTLLPAHAQSPTGAIVGLVSDPSGAFIGNANVLVACRETGLRRDLATIASGEYSAPALPPGAYQVVVEARGFQSTRAEAIVEAGRTTILDFKLPLAINGDTITVTDAVPQMHYDTFAVDGVVSRQQIESQPLNGRSFLELAKLEPGAQQPTRASTNRTFVPLLGRGGTRITVDGGSIIQIGNGGAALGFSQEVVQEFQVSTANFDLSTGATASGAVNIVTRAGGNQLHGAAFFFFRDHHLSAYPGLQRSAFNPDPFFQRRQFGFTLGGPIRKDRAFFFGTFERNEQRGVISTQLLTPEFASFSRITPSPTYSNQFSVRTDFRISEKQTAFLRYSHEGVDSFGTTTLFVGGPSAYPSAWTRQPNWADQSIIGLTSALRSDLVNDLRFSYFFVSSAERAPEASDCPGCLGMGAPQIRVGSITNPDLLIGNSITTSVLGRRYHLHNVLAWQKGTHAVRVGGDWEITRGGRTDLAEEPVKVNLFSPKTVKIFNALSSTLLSARIPLPGSFLTLADVLQLPIQNFTVGIGDPHVPQEGFGKARVAHLVHLFYQDTWRLHSRLNVNYGLGWTYDAPLNYDLAKPAYLAPVFGTNGLGPTRKNWTNFSPSVGFAWSPRSNGNTVIRGGAGIYYDFQTSFGMDAERTSLGPRGVGRGSYASGGIQNPLTGIPGVDPGTLLTFSTPTLFTGTKLMQALPAIRASLTQLRGDPNNRDFSVTNIAVDKQGAVMPGDFPSPSATNASLGVQQRVFARDFVISADFVFRQFTNVSGGSSAPVVIDVNRYASARGPVLPICSNSQRGDPRALCSLGPITEYAAIGRARYRGLLVRADKRFSHGWQVLGSYVYSSGVGHNFTNGFDSDNPLASYGPLEKDFRHILNLSGVVQLPLRFQLGFYATYNSKPPFSAYLGGLDLNGDGTTGDLLPGTTVNQFNRGLGKADLRRLVDEFNAAYAGKKDAMGRSITAINLPARFEFGDQFLTHDLRLSRELVLHEHWHVLLIGEVFNLFNLANLSGRSGDLLSAGFGRPTSRVTQVFGSGGPRSFQLAARVNF